MKVTASKHNLDRFCVDQPYKITETFKLLNIIRKKYTVKTTPPNHHSIKRLVTNMFTSLAADNKITFKPSKKKTIIKFLSVVPEIVTNSVKQSYILKGLTTPSMINIIYYRYPDFNTLLTTCQRNPPQQEYEQCYRSFPPR